jgi:motility quorum-sensing regulator / GCU-specific mRNA interferase toxin
MAKPTYPLTTVQQQVATLKAAAFTASAINGGQAELGLTLPEMMKTIATGKASDFYKTMPNNSIDKAFQDVYHLMTPLKDVAYAKFCLHPLSKVVVSFKRK